MPTTMLCNSDETSGTTVTEKWKAYWTEGRSSEVVFRFQDGRVLIMSNAKAHALLDELNEISDNGADEFREATNTEEIEHALFRNYSIGPNNTRYYQEWPTRPTTVTCG